MGPNEERVRDAVEWSTWARGWALTWQVARAGGVSRRTAKYWLAKLEHEGVVEQRRTARRVVDDRDHDGVEWRAVDVVAVSD